MIFSGLKKTQDNEDLIVLLGKFPPADVTAAQ